MNMLKMLNTWLRRLDFIFQIVSNITFFTNVCFQRSFQSFKWSLAIKAISNWSLIFSVMTHKKFFKNMLLMNHVIKIRKEKIMNFFFVSKFQINEKVLVLKIQTFHLHLHSICEKFIVVFLVIKNLKTLVPNSSIVDFDCNSRLTLCDGFIGAKFIFSDDTFFFANQINVPIIIM